MQVVVGRVGRPHGIRGEVTVECRTDEPERWFAPGRALAIEGADRELTVGRSHWHSGRLLVSFVDVPDRNAAELLRGSVLVAERPADQRPDDPEEYYDAQLVGCRAVVAGVDVGQIVDVVHLPGQDLLVVRFADDRDALVPFVTAIVPMVDVHTRTVTIDPPPGLFDPPDSDPPDSDPPAAGDAV